MIYYRLYYLYFVLYLAVSLTDVIAWKQDGLNYILGYLNKYPVLRVPNIGHIFETMVL